VAIDQRSTSSVLRLQKWAQVALAILLTGFFVLLLPGAGAFLVPLGCLYIAWAVRASSDHRFSAWLAFSFTLIVVLLGGPGVVFRISRLLDGQRISLADFSIELTLFLVAATVVALHAINWRWLISPGTRTQR
jgi:hypothetical protein